MKLIQRPSEVLKVPIVGLTAQVHRGVERRRGACSSPDSIALPSDRREGPGADAHQRDVHHRRLARPFASEEGRGDASGDGHATHGVAVGAAGLVDDPGAVRRGGGPGAAHPAPERRAVVAALLGVRAPLAVAAASHVDDLRIGLADVLDLEVQASAGVGQEVDEEDVGVLAQVHEDGMAVGMVERQSDAALAPVRVLHERLKRTRGHPAGARGADHAARPR